MIILKTWNAPLECNTHWSEVFFSFNFTKHNQNYNFSATNKQKKTKILFYLLHFLNIFSSRFLILFTTLNQTEKNFVFKHMIEKKTGMENYSNISWCVFDVWRCDENDSLLGVCECFFCFLIHIDMNQLE